MISYWNKPKRMIKMSMEALLLRRWSQKPEEVHPLSPKPDSSIKEITHIPVLWRIRGHSKQEMPSNHLLERLFIAFPPSPSQESTSSHFSSHISEEQKVRDYCTAFETCVEEFLHDRTN